MAGEAEVTMGKPASNPVDFAGGRVGELAHILALGYLRARKRQIDRESKRISARGLENPLDDVAPEATVATGERRTSETGDERG
jgi:hypothetical protein